MNTKLLIISLALIPACSFGVDLFVPFLRSPVSETDPEKTVQDMDPITRTFTNKVIAAKQVGGKRLDGVLWIGDPRQAVEAINVDGQWSLRMPDGQVIRRRFISRVMTHLTGTQAVSGTYNIDGTDYQRSDIAKIACYYLYTLRKNGDDQVEKPDGTLEANPEKYPPKAQVLYAIKQRLTN